MQASEVTTAAEEFGLEIAAVVVPVAATGMARVERTEVRKAAHGGAVVSADQKTVAPLVARACSERDRGAAVEAMGARSWSVTAEVGAVGAWAAAGVPGTAAQGRADCLAMEVVESASAPLATRSWLLPHLSS